MNYWGWQTALVIIAIALMGSFGLKKIHWLVSVNFAWVGFSILRVFVFPNSPFAGNDPAWVTQFDLASCRAFAEFAIIILAVLQLEWKSWIIFWRIVAALNACLMIGGAFTHTPYGLLVNASMSGCMAACLLPLLPFPELILSLLAALLSFRHMPYACLGAMGIIAIWQGRRFRHWLLLLIPALPVLAMRLYNSNGRGQTWALAWEFYKTHGQWITGYGGGTFQVIGPYLTRPLGSLWFWMHSDWGQVLFEQGVIGLILVGSLYFVALYRAKSRLFYSFTAFGVWAMANMPLRYPLTACLGACILREIFARKALESLPKSDPNCAESQDKFEHAFALSEKASKLESDLSGK